MTVDPQSAGYDPGPLKGYLKMLGVVYHYEEQGKVYKNVLCTVFTVCSWARVNLSYSADK